MEPILSMQTAAILLGISAVGGLAMAAIRFTGTANPPTWLAMLHGFLSAAALTILLYAHFTVGLPRLALIATALFVLAALGGVFLNLNYHWKQVPLPKSIVAVHGVLAVTGYVLLLAALFGTPVTA